MADLPVGKPLQRKGLFPSKKGNGSNSSSSSQYNPLQSDEELKNKLAELTGVKTRRVFRRWKLSFLSRFEGYLNQDGTAAAQESYHAFKQKVDQFGRQTAKVKALEKSVDSGATSSVGVKGRNALNELNKVMTEVIHRLHDLVPSTGPEEKSVGYNKYELGAVLLRDDFEVYDTLHSCRELMLAFKTGCLASVADRQLLEQIDYYTLNFNRFCDLMSDLSLYDAMMKARELADEEDILVFIDPKTGTIGELSRKAALEHGLLSVVKDEAGKETGINEAATESSHKQELKEIVEGVLKSL